MPARKAPHADVARRRREELLDLAREAALEGRLADADRYADVAWRLTTRHELAASARLKRRVCRGCHAYLVPDRTARVRVEAGSVTTTCQACGRTRRVPLDG